MPKLVLTKKTGFDVKDVFTPINIRDDRGILFYSTETLVPKVEKFNLPPGTYFVDTGNFKEAIFPRSFPGILLPPRERYFFPDPRDFRIQFASNPSKCTVNWDKRTITFDNAFKEKPWPELELILLHEHGHRLYVTEDYCDLYAAKMMYKLGYNTSQIGDAILDSLSDKQMIRKDFIINSIC